MAFRKVGAELQVGLRDSTYIEVHHESAAGALLRLPAMPRKGS